MQITLSGPTATVTTTEWPADQNGGYLRGQAKAQVALRDGLTGSLRPGAG